MLCPICKREIDDDTKFCTECGKKIPRCPTCNRVIPERTRFCVHDGTPLPESLFADLPKANAVNPPAAKPASAKAPHRCAHCGAVCPESEILCRDCQNKLSGNLRKNDRKKKNLLPLLLCLLLLAGIAAFVGYSLLNEDSPVHTVIQDILGRDKEDTTADKSDEDEESAEEETADEETEEEKTDFEEPDEGDAAADTAAPETPEDTEDTPPTDTQPPQDEAAGEDPEEQTSAALDPVEFFIMNCDKQYFSADYFSIFDAEMCRLARNGIYARMGRIFRDETLTAYFMQFDWYVPTISPDDFSESMLNEYQIANRDLIVQYENEQGFR